MSSVMPFSEASSTVSMPPSTIRTHAVKFALAKIKSGDVAHKGPACKGNFSVLSQVCTHSFVMPT